MGVYSDRIKARYSAENWTPERIRATKCARCKARNLARLAERRSKAEARQERRDRRTPQQQIAMLDATLGIGVGAVKERAKLMLQLAAA